MPTNLKRRPSLLADADRLALGFALDSLRANGVRSVLAIAGIVIGIVSVVLIASVLTNARTQVATLFQGLGTNNLIAFHLSRDPYSPPTDQELNRRPLEIGFADAIARLSPNVEEVGVQLIVPNIINGRALVASAGRIESDTCFAEGSAASTYRVIDAPLAEGRVFTEIEEQTGARVAILGGRCSDVRTRGAHPIPVQGTDLVE